MCCMGHHRFLPGDHKFCRSKKAFDGEIEMKPPPEFLFGTNLLNQMEDLMPYLEHIQRLKEK